MCGIIDDAFSFVKDSIGEIGRHPLQAVGAALGVPGYDPFFGGLFNNRPGGALISPTGNFTSSAWNDMYQANPNDTGALGLFHGVNDVADKVAPAIASAYAGPALEGALGGTGGGAADLGSSAFTTGLETPATTGALESGAGGAGLYGATAGTGTALGDVAAQGLGAGGLGIAGGGSLGGVAGTGAGMFGGTGIGTGLGTGAALPSTAETTSVGGGALSGEGSQAVTGATPGQGIGPVSFEGTGAGGGEQGYGNLSALYGTAPAGGPTPAGAINPGAGTVSAGSPTGQVLGQASGGISPAVTSTTQGAGVGDDTLSGLQGLFKLGNSLYGAWQNHQQQNAANNYANSIKDIFSPTGAYAQQMAQTLARQDAAAGRNSQYGTRAVELAARLAQAQSQALGNSNYANAAQNRTGGNFLNSLFGNFMNPQGIQQLGNAYNLVAPAVNSAGSYLSGLFS